MNQANILKDKILSKKFEIRKSILIAFDSNSLHYQILVPRCRSSDKGKIARSRHAIHHAGFVQLILGSLRYGHYGLRTTVIHGEDLVRDLLRMLDSTWVSQSVVWLQATGSSRGDSRSEDYVSIFLPIFDQFCFLNATFMLNSL